MLEVKNISKSYYKKEVLKDLSFSINKSEVFGLLGVNGAGKTTCLDIVSGYLPPDSGEVFVGGIRIKDNPEAYKKKISYLPEKPPLYDYMTVCGYLEFVCNIKGTNKKFIKDSIISVAQKFKIDDVLNRLIGHLSKGYRQRVGLAQAFIGEPEVIILDEPTSGMDPVQLNEINQTISRLCKNSAVILSSHDLSEVSQLCSKVLIIDKGKKIIEGSPVELTEAFGGKEIFTFRIKADADAVISLFKENDIGYKVLSSDGDYCCIKIEVSGVNNAEYYIGKLLFEGGMENFSVIEKRRPTLNDVFLNVVRGKESQ